MTDIFEVMTHINNADQAIYDLKIRLGRFSEYDFKFIPTTRRIADKEYGSAQLALTELLNSLTAYYERVDRYYRTARDQIEDARISLARMADENTSK